MSTPNKPNRRARRFVTLLLTAIITLGGAAVGLYRQDRAPLTNPEEVIHVDNGSVLAGDVLEQLEVKGRAPKTGYDRGEFGGGWLREASGCRVRDMILERDLEWSIRDDRCRIERGVLMDPYTKRRVEFVRGAATSADVQIDHVVSLSNAWQTGAQSLTYERRVAFSNDPINLLAVEGSINQQKGDADAATWLPPNMSFRCEYVARQVSVKYRYGLWVVPAEKSAMQYQLSRCPQQAAFTDGEFAEIPAGPDHD